MALTKATFSMIDGAQVNVLDFGAVGDGVTDDSAAIQAALDSLGNGGTVYFPLPAVSYLCNSSLNVPLGISLKGDGKPTNYFPSSYGETPKNTVIEFSGSDGLLIDYGFNNIENLQIKGASGEYVGIRYCGTGSAAPNVNTKNLSIVGFSDGVGLWLKNNLRSNHVNLDIAGCGVGIVFQNFVNAIDFVNIEVEDCALGVLCLSGGFNGVTFYGGTIEGNQAGKRGTSMPTTALLTVSASILSQIGVAQSALEGGAVLSGMIGAFVGGYFEANSLVHVFAGLDCQLSFTNCYWEDKIAVTVRPKHFIDCLSGTRTIVFEGNQLSTDSARGTSLFNIDLTRNNRFENNRFLDGVGVYTGVVYTNLGATASYATKNILRNANNELLGHRANTSYLTFTSDVSSSGGTTTINTQSASVWYVDLNENTTISLTNVSSTYSDGQYLEIHFQQDATGGRTVTWPSNVRSDWSNSGNSANLKTCMSLRYKASEDRWYQIGAQPTYHA